MGTVEPGRRIVGRALASLRFRSLDDIIADFEEEMEQLQMVTGAVTLGTGHEPIPIRRTERPAEPAGGSMRRGPMIAAAAAGVLCARRESFGYGSAAFVLWAVVGERAFAFNGPPAAPGR